MPTDFRLWFKDGNSADDEWLANQRGCRDDVIIDFPDGRRYQVSVYDPTRLAQDIAYLAESGHPYFAEPTMIVVPEVTTEHITNAVHALVDTGYFEQIVPIRGGTCEPNSPPQSV